MKRVKVENGFKGLVLKNNELVKILDKGVYWLGWNETLYLYDMYDEEIYETPIEMDLLLLNEQFKNSVNVISVNSNEIVLRKEKNKLREVLTEGEFIYWKEGKKFDFQKIDLTDNEVIKSVKINELKNTLLVNYIRVSNVESYEKGLLFIDGEFVKILDAGIYPFWKNASNISVIKIDKRQTQIELAGQEILTKDKATLRVNFFLQYKVTDEIKAVVEIKNYENQLYVLMQFALREYIGLLTLDELLEQKENVGSYINEKFSEKAKSLGVKLINSGIKDIILPGEIKDIMNQVLIAQKTAQANVITRREETASTRSLLNTAKLMEGNEMLFKLKEMEYLEKVADKIGEITVNGGGNTLKQLKEIFSSND